MWFEDPPAPSCFADPKTGSGEEGTTGKGSDLDKPLELGPVVASFLRGLPETSKDEGVQPVGTMEGQEMQNPRLVD